MMAEYFPMERTVCLKCGKPVWRVVGPITTDWTHRDATGWPRVGCRAATYNPEAKDHAYWDDAIPRSWSVTPDPTKIEEEP